MKTTFCSKTAAVVALALTMVHAAEDVAMQVTEVAAFKNGYSQVSLKGNIHQQGTELRLSGVPVPLLGSFWWQAPAGSSVCEVRSESSIVKVTKPQFSTMDFLAANAGTPAEIVLSNGATLVGTICVPEPAVAAASFQPYTNLQIDEEYENHDAESEAPAACALPQAGGAVVQLRTASGMATLREQNILYAEVKNPTPHYPTEDKRVTDLVVQLSAPAQGKTMQVSCLSSGLSWMPSYRMDLGNNGKAYFQGKAMVMNELADLNHVKLELVMGYPALGKYLLPSPLAQYHSLSRFLNLISDATSPSYRNIASNLTNNSYSYDNAPKNGSGSLTQAEDLFFYTIPDFTCAAGQTVAREIFAGEVDYSHVYTWNVPRQSDIDEWLRAKRYQGADGRVTPPDEVWHCVRVHNSLKSPWTTGVLDCYADGRLVGRTEVNFTAEGGSALVRLNKTMQAPVQFSETLLSREDNVMTLEGTLSLTNHTGKEMHVIITKEVYGTPLSADNHAVITCTPSYRDNPDGQFRWELTVPAGETQTVTYRYSHKDD